MYIRTHIGIGGEEPLLGQPSTKQYKGGEAIGEKDGQKLLTILAGRSPYQDYILPVMATQGSALPKDFFRIVHQRAVSGARTVAGSVHGKRQQARRRNG